jgi:hypothetical protein
MHPVHHAQSSARRLGGSPLDYLPYHNWFDASKATIAHFTHRSLRHHKEGIAALCDLRGASVIRNSDGGAFLVTDIGCQHCEEDTGIGVPSAEDWLKHLQAPDWLPLEIPEIEDLASGSSRVFGGCPEIYMPLHSWFLETAAWFSDNRHLAMRHHSFGIFEAEERFGFCLNAGGDTISGVPVRVVAERHVRLVLQKIPSATDWIKRVKSQSWMSKSAKNIVKLPFQ